MVTKGVKAVKFRNFHFNLEAKYRTKLKAYTTEKRKTERQVEEQRISAVKEELKQLETDISASKLSENAKEKLLTWMATDLKTLNERIVLKNVSAVSYRSLKDKVTQEFCKEIIALTGEALNEAETRAESEVTNEELG